MLTKKQEASVVDELLAHSTDFLSFFRGEIPRSCARVVLCISRRLIYISIKEKQWSKFLFPCTGLRFHAAYSFCSALRSRSPSHTCSWWCGTVEHSSHTLRRSSCRRTPSTSIDGDSTVPTPHQPLAARTADVAADELRSAASDLSDESGYCSKTLENSTLLNMYVPTCGSATQVFSDCHDSAIMFKILNQIWNSIRSWGRSQKWILPSFPYWYPCFLCRFLFARSWDPGQHLCENYPTKKWHAHDKVTYQNIVLHVKILD